MISDKPLLYLLAGVASGELTPGQALPLIKQAVEARQQTTTTPKPNVTAPAITPNPYASIHQPPSPQTWWTTTNVPITPAVASPTYI